ncbi:T9SS type A sorting domain-containing protein [Xanthocytophaga agilis]|uniref:T9SS type A sorting domain-containing protein n=1 Tax=Xanthocytophaga agilis TaxID=3048010 RepID=A0AAE3UEP3_9BACT|nr:T9SS type A sorting domain-containing protein [Xanthocytophaga agilis]MDJ1501556.1 T9SS type A sorting domain-containing protein [Xanthocytophaga agilis]
MKHFYLLLVFIGSFVMSSYGVNSPLLLAPQNGATINLNTLSGFNVNANEPTTWKLYIKVSINDPRQLVYENSHTFTSTDQTTEPFLFPFSNGNPLEPNHQYLVELKTVDAANALISQEYFTFFTSSAEKTSPLLVSPSSGDTLYLTGAITFDAAKWTVNANNPNARSISTEIFDVATGQELTSLFPGDPFPISKSLTAQTALTNVELQSYVSYIRQQPYAARVVLTTKDSLQNIIGQSEYPIIIKPRPLGTDVNLSIISPVNGQTGVSTSPTVTVQKPSDIAVHGVGILVDFYTIDKYPMDAQGEDYRMVWVSNISTITSWQIPNLKPGTTYELNIHYLVSGARGNPSGTSKNVRITFTTAPQPLLVSPSPGDTLYVKKSIYHTEVEWTVNSNNPNARSITAQIFDVATGTQIDYQYDPFPTRVGLTAQTALNNVKMTSFIQDLRQEPYAARLVLITRDSLQNIIGQGEYPIIIKPLPLAADIFLTITSPVNGQTNVSTSPSITVQRPAGLDRHGITVSLYSYKIDKYPADNQGEDYRFVTLQGTPSISTWQIPGLKPGTTYEMEILYVIERAGGDISGTGKTVKTIFTTAPDQGTNSLLLWPANNQSVTICNNQDVLVNANDSTARTLIVKVLKNDPRQLVQDYMYALNGTTATQTISMAGVVQQLLANQQYLIEATTKNASGTILRQQYFTVFTTGCSQSAARIGSPEVELPQKSVISPNPSAGDFQVQLHSGYGKAKVEIVSLEGRIIANYETEGNHAVLMNGSSLKPGLYLVRITGNAGLREQFKIVKQ